MEQVQNGASSYTTDLKQFECHEHGLFCTGDHSYPIEHRCFICGKRGESIHDADDCPERCKKCFGHHKITEHEDLDLDLWKQRGE